MFKQIEINTTKTQECINITDMVLEIVSKSNIKEGVCIINNTHSTSGVFINSYLDLSTLDDISDAFNRLIPTIVNFKHQFDTPSDAAAHIKSVLSGNNESIIIHDNKLMLGGSQGIIFFEMDGPRKRKVNVQIIGK